MVLHTLLMLTALAQGASSASARPPVPGLTTAIAVPANPAPVVDGRDNDDVWRTAPAITQFRQWQPKEDTEPSFRTEARIAYDNRNVYVFVRAFDPHPDSILQLLARRDAYTAADQIWVMIDSYHDKRTGFEFAVNPAGVKRDFAIYNDGNEDDAWDAVWEVKTAVDSLGWTAEYRIPLSQLRFVPGSTNTFGLAVWRDIQRYPERVSWPLYRVSGTGMASQFGEVTLTGLASPRRLEVIPYLSAKSAPVPTATGFDREHSATGGADLKYGITSNLTLDATVNPDFGQVESDPAVLNLSAFETFFGERRPFFVSGAGSFQFNVNCSAVNCSGENLFYSRRIGRSPQLAGSYGDASSPTSSTILGAGKLTGRLAGGLTLSLLEAYTQREVGTESRTIEPGTNYAVLRMQQDLRGSESGVGVMATAVNRNLDEWTEGSVRKDAYVGAVDFRHRFGKRKYEISGFMAASRVSGSADAIAATQTSPVHFFQRPDAGLTFDPTRTSLAGHAQELYFGKVGGGQTRFQTSYQRRSPGFEVNDIGFLRQAGMQSWNTWFALQFQKPALFYQRAFWNFNWWQVWTTEGLPLERAGNTNAHVQLNNRWWWHGGGTVSPGSIFSDRQARGGPALRISPWVSLWTGLEGDNRPAIVPYLWFNYWRGEGGRSRNLNVSPELSLRVASQFTTNLGVSLSWNRDHTQWFGNFTDGSGATHYTFAHLEQKTASLNWRLNFTVTPELSLQLYAQPFVSKGTYSNVVELNQPRADDYDQRFQPYADTAVTNNPGGFNFMQFRSNVVARWEYRPGSTLFLVWTQGRQDFQPVQGQESLIGDFRNLFGQRSENIFLVKASYWINY